MVIEIEGYSSAEKRSVEIAALNGRVCLTCGNFQLADVLPADALKVVAALKAAADEASMPVFGGFAWNALRVAFGQVRNAEDWKAPISVQVKESRVELIIAAIAYFTSTKAEVSPGKRKGYVLVTAAGYRAGPAGP